MKKASPIRRLLVFPLLFALVLSLCPAALASFAEEQYYEENTGLTWVCTVQVSAGKNWSGAVRRRDQMLSAGYDGFIYRTGDLYRVMCGKFRDLADAESYCRDIIANTDRSDAYVTNACLDEASVRAFEAALRGVPAPGTAYLRPEAGQAIDAQTKNGSYGTAKSLSGRTVIVSVFASDATTGWDFNAPEDHSRYSVCYHDLRMACEWLTGQCAGYGVQAEFVWDWLMENDLFYIHRFDGDLVSAPDSYEACRRYIETSVDTDGLMQKYDAGNILYLFHLNTPTSNPEDSRAFSFGPLDGDSCGYELAVMFTGLRDSVAAPGTYAHGILRLFGVPDMSAANEDYRMSAAFADWYRANYAQDVMAGAHTGDHSRMDCTFSPLTAYYAGLCARPYEADRWGLRLSDYGR